MISSWHKKAASSISGCALKLSFFFFAIPPPHQKNLTPGYFEAPMCRFSFMFFNVLLKHVHFWNFISEMCELLSTERKAWISEGHCHLLCFEVKYYGECLRQSQNRKFHRMKWGAWTCGDELSELLCKHLWCPLRGVGTNSLICH